MNLINKYVLSFDIFSYILPLVIIQIFIYINRLLLIYMSIGYLFFFKSKVIKSNQILLNQKLKSETVEIRNC